MIALSVNVNKIATLRNARGGGEPSVTAFARAALEAGVQGVTVHPRPDGRHITRSDVLDLVPVVAEFPDAEFNIEGYPDHRFLEIVRRARPHQATLVPDPPGVLTSNAGWNTRGNEGFLKEVLPELRDCGARVSLFIETDGDLIAGAAEVGADRVELYTGPYAEAHQEGRGQESFEAYANAARAALGAGLGLNAGHDLNLDNLVLFRELPGLQEVSIGHALTCDALRMGWQPAIRAYLEVLSATAATVSSPS